MNIVASEYKQIPECSSISFGLLQHYKTFKSYSLLTLISSSNNYSPYSLISIKINQITHGYRGYPIEDIYKHRICGADDTESDYLNHFP